MVRSTEPSAFERCTGLQHAAALALRFLAQWIRPMPCEIRDAWKEWKEWKESRASGVTGDAV